MNDETKNTLLAYFLGLSMGQMYAYFGVFIMFLTFFGEGLVHKYLGIAPDQVDRAFWSGVVLWIVGTAMYIWRTMIESKERRTGERVTTPTSILSLELARTLPPEGMTLQEISDVLPSHPHDEAKSEDVLLKTLKRARIREAAKDGQECYFNNGHYYSRSDQTILG